jgi:hypothetical protein
LIEATLYRLIDVGLLVSVVFRLKEAMVDGVQGLHYELIGEVVPNVIALVCLVDMGLLVVGEVFDQHDQ